MIYRRILVTGSSGVLGTAFQEISKNYPSQQFIFCTSSDCDLTNYQSTIEYIGTIEPDAIIHLAAVSGGVALSIKHPATLLRDNVTMAINVLEATRLHEISKALFALSSGMYPPDAPLPIKEEYIHLGPAHESNYGYSYAKRLLEPAIRAYRAEFGLNVIGLVPNGMFGEGDKFDDESAVMLTALIRRFHENKNTDNDIVVWSDGSPLREFTYSHDMARAFMWCLENYNNQSLLNVGSTEEYSVKDIAFMIAEAMSIPKGRIKFDTSKPFGVYQKSTDNSRFLSMSKFEYIPFKIALEKTIKWFVYTYENCPEKIPLGVKLKQ